MKDEILTVAIFGQQTTRAGQRCWCDEGDDNECDDLDIHTGTRDELREHARLLNSTKYPAGTDLFMRKVAKTLCKAAE